MSRLCVFMLPLAPDYSGAASALFDLGGIVVMHDASGCTGNFTGYDEPRWMGSRSGVYCSGLRRMDAVLGNDKKFIEGTLKAAEDLHPSLIAYLGSPVPTVIGTDLQGIAAEIEDGSGIPSFGFSTTGLNYYDKGASDVFVSLIKRFAKKPEKKEKTKETSPMRVNVLGMLPLDVGNKGNCERILEFLKNNGCEVAADFAMGLSVEQIKACTGVDLNIVIAKSGLEAARYLEKKYRIPYLCGIPLGDGTAFLERLNAKEKTVSKKPQEDLSKKGILIIHEQVFAGELRNLIRKKTDDPITVGGLFGLDKELREAQDVEIKDEHAAMEEINSGKYHTVIADPEFDKILSRDDVRLIGLPHLAVSSKLHWDEYPDYLGEELKQLVESAAEGAK